MQISMILYVIICKVKFQAAEVNMIFKVAILQSRAENSNIKRNMEQMKLWKI